MSRPPASGAWNVRLGVGWEAYLARTLALFVETGGRVRVDERDFGSVGLRW